MGGVQVLDKAIRGEHRKLRVMIYQVSLKALFTEHSKVNSA